ncbi:MAG: acyl-CoA dehydrogenase family protein [Dehalococcoidia bacterium]
MDFTWNENEQQFAAEMEEFFRLRPGKDAPAEEHEEYRRELYRRGLPTMHWPEEHGGNGAGHMEQLLLKETAHRYGVRIGTPATTMVGPTIMLHGSAEQQAEFLPRIAAGEIEWCQGFSEPGAGSDLASLQTRGERVGDDYVVNGQKVWTSSAHLADWIFVLVRTDKDAPKHRGISYLLADMHTPGIRVNPLINLAGDHGFNEVFFEDVHIPVSNRVGEENRGWYVATTTLDFERSGIERVLTADGDLTRLEGYVREKKAAGAEQAIPEAKRNQLAEMRVQTEVSRLLAHRVAWMQSQGLVPNYEASMAKMFGSDVGQSVARLGANLDGMHGQLAPDEPGAPLDGALSFRYLDSVRLTIGQGTGEIQRNVIATRGLGLPRG